MCRSKANVTLEQANCAPGKLIVLNKKEFTFENWVWIKLIKFNKTQFYYD